MKTRNGFVSNSSSSSFTCEICGETGSGMDASMSDFDMSECKNGHVICDEHRLKGEPETAEEKRQALIAVCLHAIDNWGRWAVRQEEATRQKYLDYQRQEKEQLAKLEAIEDIDAYFEDGEGAEWWNDYQRDSGFSVKECPICQFEHLRDEDTKRFMKWYYNLTDMQACDILKKVFANYTEFREATK